jgi:predicted transcriptional regulator
MALQLWYSEDTKISRKGTTYSELQNVFVDKITTKFIYEPLACCRITNNLSEVKQILELNGFDVLGVVDSDEKKIGYIVFAELEESVISEYVKPFEAQILISDSTPICDLIDILLENEFVFILEKNSIEGIITRADINKPIVRIYLFGLITLFELHLSYWINKYYHESEWMSLLKTKRIDTAIELFEKRKGSNSQLTLLECIQICDKKSILKETDTFLELFSYSKRRFESLMNDSETIRNELAHSQNSIIDTLSWSDFVSTISAIREFLNMSEKSIKS